MRTRENHFVFLLIQLRRFAQTRKVWQYQRYRRCIVLQRATMLQRRRRRRWNEDKLLECVASTGCLETLAMIPPVSSLPLLLCAAEPMLVGIGERVCPRQPGLHPLDSSWAALPKIMLQHQLKIPHHVAVEASELLGQSISAQRTHHVVLSLRERGFLSSPCNQSPLRFVPYVFRRGICASELWRRWRRRVRVHGWGTWHDHLWHWQRR
mmetsp:Transcript_8234/g.22803  ORF Transcript_8234/g.22803 Transcript_8234/m.22803 type:complete len:209 (+) Transcript_8234:601-1227(+)